MKNNHHYMVRLIVSSLVFFLLGYLTHYLTQFINIDIFSIEGFIAFGYICLILLILLVIYFDNVFKNFLNFNHEDSQTNNQPIDN